MLCISFIKQVINTGSEQQIFVRAPASVKREHIEILAWAYVLSCDIAFVDINSCLFIRNAPEYTGRPSWVVVVEAEAKFDRRDL